MITKVNEKREIIENTLEAVHLVEADVTSQRDKVIQDIKNIVKNLEKKISEIANERLDLVNKICEKKKLQCQENEAKYNEIKNAIVHIEQFAKLFLEEDNPIVILKTKRLISQQVRVVLFNQLSIFNVLMF